MDNSAKQEKSTRSYPAEAPDIIVRACDMCRKKKIRCEPAANRCLQCIKYQTHCHFTPISMKRKPRRPAGYKNILELEERLKRMEGLLKTAIDKNRVEKGDSLEDHNSAFSVIDLENDGEQGSQRQLMTMPHSRRLGHVRASNLPVVSLSLSTQFRENDMPDQNVRMFYEPSLHPSPAWKGSLVHDTLSRHTYHLPSKSFALVLIEDAFKSFNCTFPIFDQQAFLQSFQDHYSESSPNDPGWWACINVVLSLAHRFRAMRTFDTGYENAQACGYMQNALGVLSELTILPNSLPALQALLGMIIILQGTPNPRLCSVLISVTMRLAQAMGLQRKNQDPSLTEAEIEQRRNVFWIAYVLDKDISLRMRQPPAQDDDDMDVELPSGTISEVPLCCDGLGTVNFFNCRIGLAIIQGQIYKKLHSVQAARQSESQQVAAAYELDAMLACWRSSFPIDFDDTMATFQAPVTSEFLHLAVLYLTYINCLNSVHHPFPQINRASIDPVLGIRSALSASESICIIESRKAIRILQLTPRGDYACVWLLIQYFFAAVSILLHNVLLNPTYLHARSDLLLVGPFLQLLEILAREGKSEDVQRMFYFCTDLNGRARESVEHFNRRMVCEKSREARESREEKESVEEFIMRVECISAGCIESHSHGSATAERVEPIGETWAERG